MDDCFCIYNGETDKFVLSFFFQLPPIVNSKVMFVNFQKNIIFFVFFFTFSICERSKKNWFFSTFFKKCENILKSYSENSEIMLTWWVSSDSVNADHIRCARAGVVDGVVPAENLYSLKSFVECCHTNNCNHT